MWFRVLLRYHLWSLYCQWYKYLIDRIIMKIIEVYKKVSIYGKKVKKSQNKNKNSEWNFFKKNRGPDWIMDLLLKLWTCTLNFGIVWKKPEKISSEKLLQQISRHFLLSTFVVLWGVFQNFVFMDTTLLIWNITSNWMIPNISKTISRSEVTNFRCGIKLPIK